MKQEHSANYSKTTALVVYTGISSSRIGVFRSSGAWSLAFLAFALVCGCENPLRHYFVSDCEVSSRLRGIKVVDPNQLFLGTIQIFIDENNPTKLYVNAGFELERSKSGQLSSISLSCTKENSTIFDVQVNFDDESTHQSIFVPFPIDFPPEWLEGAFLTVRPNVTTLENLKELKIELHRKEIRVNRSVV